MDLDNVVVIVYWNYSILDGRSGDHIPVGKNFPHSSRLALGTHVASSTMGTACFSKG